MSVLVCACALPTSRLSLWSGHSRPPAKGGRDIPWEFESAGIREYRYPNISPVIGGGVATIAGVGRSGETSKASQLPARLRRFLIIRPMAVVRKIADHLARAILYAALD